MRAVAYYRPLSPDDAAGDDPLSAIQRYCVEEFHQLVATIPDENELDLDDARFQRLIDHFSGPEGRDALVIVPDSTHLAGDLVELARRVIEIESVGGTVRCADFDAPDPLQDGLERLALPGRQVGRARQLEEAIMTKAARGEVIGRLPYGYRAGTDGSFVPVPEEAEVVAQIFDWYLGEPSSDKDELGDGSSGIGLRRIAARLNERGIVTRAGKRWSPVAVGGALRNRAYVGTYNRRGMRLAANHPPIVDRAVFNRVQKVLDSRKPVRKRRRPAEFLLGGLLSCAECGGGVHGLTRSRKWTNKDGAEVGREYRYYECPLHRRSGKDQHAAWRAEELESAVLEALEEYVRKHPSESVIVRDEDGSDDVTRAEAAFLRQLRTVASGSERLGTLAPFIDEVEVKGGVEASEGVQSRPIVGLMTEIESGDFVVASAAIRHLLRRIDVGSTKAEIRLAVKSR